MNHQISVVIGHSLGSQTSRLTRLIAQLRPQWTVSALAQSAGDLAAQLEKCAPDICVLDLGHGRGSSLLLRDEGTAHPESLLVVSRNAADAAVAFDMEATDFVHDPICEQRLEAALSRLESVALSHRRLPGPLPADRPAKRVKFLKVVAGTRIMVAPVGDIRYLQAERKFTRVYLEDRTGIVKESLSTVYGHLNPEQFWQTHRSTVVNAHHIREVERDDIGRLQVKVADYPNSLHVAKPRERLFRGGFIA